jgi:NADH-quinone oxidoreductase subunit M
MVGGASDGRWPILSLVTFLPLVGVLIILFINDDSEIARRNIRMVALLTTLFTFALSLLIWAGFDYHRSGLPVRRKGDWLGGTASPTRWASTAFRCCS